MKKNGFLEGTFIATASVIICKILGLIYVIPFYSIIGSQGGALYSYAYSIYAIFLNLATVGIPTAISKIVSEYNALEYFVLKQKAYKIGSKILIGFGLLFFLILFIFAPQIAYLIKGNATGGNSLESVTLVIRTISTALLIVPILSVKRGYLQGHKYIAVPQISTVIEQIVRVLIVVLGSFISYKIFNLSLEWSVAIAVFGATLGALFSYLFVDKKIKKNIDKFNLDAEEKEEEKKYTNKILLKKIVYYALPFVLIDLVKSAYDIVDLFTVVRTLTNIGYTTETAENVVGIISTWASKLNMIVISISMGLTASLIPNIMPSFVKGDFKDLNRKINKTLQILIILAIPMTIGISFLSYPVWNAFYGYNEVGIKLLKIYVFMALTISFQSVLVDTSQIMNNTKLTFGSLFLGLLIKLCLNVPFMYLFNKIGINGYYGSIVASILSQFITIIFLLWRINIKYHIEYKETFMVLLKTLFSCFVMMIVLFILNIFIPVEQSSKIVSCLICFLYSCIGGIIYFITALKLGIIPYINNVSDIKKIIDNKLLKKRKINN